MSGSLKSKKPYPPKGLKKLQEWFGEKITFPYCEGSLASSSIEEYIKPTRLLKAHQRLEIYQQVYWWRLSTVMEKDFPLLYYLMGPDGFKNKIIEPYLCAYPPDKWSLDLLGERLPHWIETSFKGKEKKLLKEASLLELALLKASIASDGESLKEIEEAPLTLKPDVTLLWTYYDLVPFRETLLDHSVEYWAKHPFPKLEQGPVPLVIFRREKIVSLQSVEALHFRILQEFLEPTTLDQLCERLETYPEQEHLQKNFQKWMKQSVQWLN